MRRTYKSKKDTSNCVDPRDAVLGDDKSSVFDAFYIQNIKQSKRELSSISSSNQYGVASNKVRKRKYAIKIVRDMAPPANKSVSESIFLTPDKSIRVNKAPDLFDQLLQSSPASFAPQYTKEKDSFAKLFSPKTGKTYPKQRRRKIKKFNYSSTSSSESEKENTSNNNSGSQNVTDIRLHSLVVEKELKPVPKANESIYNIVNKMALFNDANNSSDSFKALRNNFIKNKNRLTMNFQPKSSPSTSTPCNNKRKSNSIYKFSPIPLGLEESPNYETIVEENNDPNESVIFIPKNVSTIRDIESPVSHLPKHVNSIVNKTKSLFCKEHVNSKLSSLDNLKIKVEALEIEDVINESGSIATNYLQTSEEPFAGFHNEREETSNCGIENNNASVLHDSKDIIQYINTNCSEAISGTLKISKETSELSLEFVESSQQFSGITTEGFENDAERDTSVIVSVPKTRKETSHSTEDGTKLLYDSLNTESEHKDDCMNMSDYEYRSNVFIGLTKEEMRRSLDSNSDRVQKSGTSDSTCSGNTLSFNSYDTCTSNQNSSENKIIINEPVVAVERMDISLFQKYYDKKIEYNSDSDNTSVETDDEFASFASRESIGDLNSNDKAWEKEKFEHSDPASLSISSNDEDGGNDATSMSDEIENMNSCKNEEERSQSFVTTRRRNEVTRNSSIFILNDSCASSSSTDFDKTVLSCKKIDIDVKLNDNPINKLDVNSEKEIIDSNNAIVNNANESNMLSDDTLCSISHVSTRKNSKLVSKSSIRKTPEITESEKPSIILQPGKKWERSLSIYRRMTMMTDQFEHSILEDKDINAKGRKYRQSVISMMEMQDSAGSLHNESFHNRRSTFISKPCRSTIRIVKEPSRISLCNTTVFDDLKGFLEDCDDTAIELSKLSIADSEHEITVLENFHESSRSTTARDYVLRRCNQLEAILFDECYPDAVLKNCRKIGEGVYGEVYLWRATDGRARVMKIVPIAGTIKVNGEQQKDFQEIISEIVIAMELSALRAPIAEIECHFDEGRDVDELDLHSVENASDVFNEVLAVRCVYGGYPSRLLDLWELYDECKGSENDNPAILPVDQQYIVLELANAGQDLESYQFNNAEQAHALFWQVAFGLAVAEESYQFEHRDLHWGNVLIAPTDQKFATFVVRGRLHRVPRRGVAATIIDYSLSRLSLPLAARDSAALYNDLGADEGLFSALGDYQFQVYRLMRDKLGNDWKNFEPYTNILWLHYTLDKMITALRYKRTNTKIHKQYIAKLKGLKDRVLDYGSAVQLVLTDIEY